MSRRTCVESSAYFSCEEAHQPPKCPTLNVKYRTITLLAQACSLLSITASVLLLKSKVSTHQSSSIVSCLMSGSRLLLSGESAVREFSSFLDHCQCLGSGCLTQMVSSVIEADSTFWWLSLLLLHWQVFLQLHAIHTDLLDQRFHKLGNPSNPPNPSPAPLYISTAPAQTSPVPHLLLIPANIWVAGDETRRTHNIITIQDSLSIPYKSFP